MKIELKMNNDTLMAINNALEVLYYHEVSGVTAKVAKSIALDVSDKFDSKCRSLAKKATLFDTKKKHKMTFKYHEAWALYGMLLELIQYVDNVYQDTLIRKVINTLDQKFA
jgi:Holliday junction resolvasome RuvABC DNA-binding subunit